MWLRSTLNNMFRGYRSTSMRNPYLKLLASAFTCGCMVSAYGIISEISVLCYLGITDTLIPPLDYLKGFGKLCVRNEVSSVQLDMSAKLDS